MQELLRKTETRINILTFTLRAFTEVKCTIALMANVSFTWTIPGKVLLFNQLDPRYTYDQNLPSSSSLITVKDTHCLAV